MCRAGIGDFLRDVRFKVTRRPGETVPTLAVTAVTAVMAVMDQEWPRNARKVGSDLS